MADLLASSKAVSSDMNKVTGDPSAFGLCEEEVSTLIDHATAWASVHGLLVSTGDASYAHVPLSLLPVKVLNFMFLLFCVCVTKWIWCIVSS